MVNPPVHLKPVIRKKYTVVYQVLISQYRFTIRTIDPKAGRQAEQPQHLTLVLYK